MPPSEGPASTPAPDDARGARSSGATGRRPHVFGILGGIASGKSTASEALAGGDGVVLSADRVAHAALEDPDIQRLLVERFGPEVVGADGRADRAALAARVFEDPEGRKDLEGWIHPVVRETLRAAFEAAVQDGAPRLVLDVPLLLENADDHGLLELCDTLVFVDAPIEERDRRAVQSRGWEPGEVARRERAQMPLAAKRARADHILRNDRGPDELRADALRLLETLGLVD